MRHPVLITPIFIFIYFQGMIQLLDLHDLSQKGKHSTPKHRSSKSISSDTRITSTPRSKNRSLSAAKREVQDGGKGGRLGKETEKQEILL